MPVVCNILLKRRCQGYTVQFIVKLLSQRIAENGLKLLRKLFLGVAGCVTLVSVSSRPACNGVATQLKKSD